MKRWFFFLCSMVFFSLQYADVVVITGASRGIGYETAKLFADRGHTVYGIVRGDKYKDLQKENICFLSINYRDENSIKNAIDRINQESSGVDILINNAGYALIGPVETLAEDQIQDQMEVNFFAPVRFVKAVLPIMKKKGSGCILNISSINAVASQPFGSLYCASKAALESFSESLYAELLPLPIKVCMLQPGPLKTDFQLIMGGIEHDQKDLQQICNSLKESIEKRLEHPIFNEHGQTAKEIANLIYEIVNDPNPKLRYQTSAFARSSVADKLKDLDGEIFKKQMLAP